MSGIAISVPNPDRIEFTEDETKMARLWAAREGIALPKRGRLSGDILLQWHNAGRPQFEIPVKFVIPRDDKRVFSAWARANGYETDSAAYAVWSDGGKPAPVGYWSADTVAELTYTNAEGNEHTVPVTKSALQDVRGVRTGRPATADYLTAAGMPEGSTPVRLVTANGAQHSITLDEDTDGWVIRWETKRDANDQLATQITEAHDTIERLEASVTDLTSERDALAARVAELEAAAAEHVCKPAPRKRAPRKPAAAE